MKLIDADNFVDNLKLMLNRSRLGEISSQESISVGELATLIKDEPAAYDMDKVVEWLKLNKVAVAKAIDENWKSKYSLIKKKDLKELFEVYTREQIAIVKSGGINQNICQ